ncbi:MAG: hypothetical protein ACYTFI_25975 [Planctomycetota bacterium]|jgi:hypothetical protein
MAREGTREGRLPRPGPVGRGVRLLLGLAVLYLFAGVVGGFSDLSDGVSFASPLTWAGLCYALYAIPDIVGIPFSLPLQARNVRFVTAGLLVLAGAVDLILGGSPNGATFGITFGLLLALVLGVLGASLIVAAAVAAPG